MMQELNYIRCGDYYIPDIRLPEETRPIGRWAVFRCCLMSHFHKFLISKNIVLTYQSYQKCSECGFFDYVC